MLKITTPFFLLFSLTSNAQIPDYFGNNPTWYCASWDSDQWNLPAEPYTEEYLYYLNGDTVALGFTYHRVFRKGYRNYENTLEIQDVTFDEQTPFYIRQVGRSIRFYTLANNVDSLLVSYAYNIGDTVSGNIFQACHSNDTIQKIDSVLVNSEYRRVFYLDTLNGPIFTEGIGHQNEITGSGGEFLEPPCIGIGFDFYINCYGQNDIPLWDSDGNGGSCFLNVGAEKISTSFFNISPNPTSHHFTINASSEFQMVTTIFDSHGNVVLKTNELTISIDHLSKGMYFIECTDQFGNFHRTKLILA